MLTKKELEDWFEDHWNIIGDLHISIHNALRLKKNIYQCEEQIKRHGFFQHHWYQLKFIMIIQLAKLFDNRSTQRRNFHKLFDQLTNEIYDEEMETLLKSNRDQIFTNVFKSPKEIEQTVNEIRNELKNQKTVIDKVIDARDKVYAHLDPKATVEAVTSDELKKLIDLSAYIFNNTRGKLFNIHAEFTGTPDWDVDFVLREASANRRKVLEMLGKKKRGG